MKNMKKTSLIVMAALIVMSSLAVSAAVSANDGQGNRKPEEKGMLKGAVETLIDARLLKEGMRPQVQINTNGKVLVRGAKVTAVSGNTITAQLAWGSYVT